jgi:hypothetical protein
MVTKLWNEYHISKPVYEELQKFCQQYPAKKEQLLNCYGVSAQILSDMPRGGATTDPTSRQGERAANLRETTEAIESCLAEAAGPVYYDWMLQGVTEGLGPYTIGITSRYRREEYYRRRTKFFYLLAVKLHKV